MTGIHPSSSAQLSLNVPAEEENHMGWFCVDDDGSLAKKETHPLLVGHTSVMVAKQPEFKVRILGGARFDRGLTWGALVLDPVTLVKSKCFGSIGDGCWEPASEAQPLSEWQTAG